MNLKATAEEVELLERALYALIAEDRRWLDATEDPSHVLRRKLLVRMQRSQNLASKLKTLK